MIEHSDLDSVLQDRIVKSIAKFYYNNVKNDIDTLDGDLKAYLNDTNAWAENKDMSPHIEVMRDYFNELKAYLRLKKYDDDNNDYDKVRKLLKNKAYKGVFMKDGIL